MDVLNYRGAEATDIPDLIDLGLKSYGQFADTLGEEHWSKMEQAIRDRSMWIKLLDVSAGFVATHDWRIVGMAFLIPSGNPNELFQPDWSYIRMVGVDIDFSNQGIARMLTSKCLDEAKRRGERYVALHTSEFMDAARHLYESLGFRRLKEISARFGRRYWIYILEL
jgi:ribosomal protein S18 acetylase RimI-like enzyme